MLRRLLVLCALISAAPAQQPQPTDWDKTVEKAHKHRRIMLRRAAAKKVASAGDAAIPAVRRFEQKHGRQSISIDVVTAYQRSKDTGAKTLALLEEWARDRDFYWRSQALGALANRRLETFRPLFIAGLSDVAYLTRIQAGRGLCLLHPEKDRDKVLALLRDDDPRVRVRIASCLVEEKDDRGLPTLVEALRQDAKFLDNPWGALGASAALKTLRRIASEDFGYRPGVAPKDNEAAIKKFVSFAKKRLGARWRDPIPAFRDTRSYIGGLAIRSCRNGDLFLRFTDDRHFVFGLEADAVVPVDRSDWDRLFGDLPGSGRAIRGRVVCDYARLMCKNPTLDQKSAPGFMPTPTGIWLEAAAAALEKKGRAGLAGQLRGRLEQFLPRRIPK